ncbi:MAG TPA: hypothetical protein VGP85_10505 [Pyrinomonadaceae bacterium]|jgi:hypothetical protein|nr:hypothetical protein [Pyrinomonadaceae bacterium]
MPAGTAVADETAGEVSKQVNYSSKKLGGLLLAFFVVLGIATIGSGTAQAQYPDYRRDQYPDYRRDRDRDYRRDRDDRYRRNDRYDDRYGYNNSYQIAQQQGYREGLSTGAADAQRGQSYDPQRSHFWKNGSDGYDSRYGNKGQYKQVFRNAFVQGYNEGYQRYGGYNRRGNNGRWGNGRIWPW